MIFLEASVKKDMIAKVPIKVEENNLRDRGVLDEFYREWRGKNC